MIKDTLFIQEISLVAFANALGFYMVQNERGLRYFADAREVKVSMERMIEWHNGTLRGRAYWHTSREEMARIMSQAASREITEQQLQDAYDQRLVYEIKFKYSKKKAMWVKQYQSDHIVKFTELGRANYNY